MEKDEVEDRKRLLARLEKEREILQILEEVRRQSGHICTDTCHYLAEYCFSGGHADLHLSQHFNVSVPIHVPTVNSKIIT